MAERHCDETIQRQSLLALPNPSSRAGATIYFENNYFQTTWSKMTTQAFMQRVLMPVFSTFHTGISAIQVLARRLKAPQTAMQTWSIFHCLHNAHFTATVTLSRPMFATFVRIPPPPMKLVSLEDSYFLQISMC
jgi:nitrate reductase gamma subunit